MWTVYDHLFSSIFWVTGTVGIVLNTYLIYLIFFHAPETLKVYRVFLANATIADLIFAISTTFAQIRIIPNKWAFAYVPLGPAAYFGSEVSYISYCIMLHSLFYTFLSYPLSFGFRYSVLVRPMPSIKTCVLICLALWTIAIAQLVLFVFSEADPDFIRQYLATNKPQYNLTGFVISGNHMLQSPHTCVTLASIVLPMFPIYVIVIYFYKKVNGYLDDSSTNMRESTVRGHRRLMHALTIQASLPLLFVFPPILIYALYHFELINFTIIEYLVYVLFRYVIRIYSGYYGESTLKCVEGMRGKHHTTSAFRLPRKRKDKA
ncbi:unnamed protein product [Heligmosomoides polygyrus]|uniref:G_PROTEIN_RECEP_F1_2 domain-containing protein n=1 Tax=Heligmosomoides polygyrus TaxID=6339 RepID=A0A3P8BTB3_HELPZ|nr:unnamed protein product [Heligmosomoides polygyrus]